jgi:hypothetical protein
MKNNPRFDPSLFGDAEHDLKAVIECENGILLDLEASYVNASQGPSWVVQGDRGTAWVLEKTLHARYLQGKAAEFRALDGQGPDANSRRGRRQDAVERGGAPGRAAQILRTIPRQSPSIRTPRQTAPRGTGECAAGL